MGGWVSFVVQASGVLHFTCTITGEGPGSVAWGFSNRPFQTVTITDLPPHSTPVSIAVLAGDTIVFDIQAGLFNTPGTRRLALTKFDAPAPPRLQITKESGDVIISWPLGFGTDFRLESRNSHAPIDGAWSAVTAPLETTATEFRLALPSSQSASYYRLRADP
jgi:hypothetical protein